MQYNIPNKSKINQVKIVYNKLSNKFNQTQYVRVRARNVKSLLFHPLERRFDGSRTNQINTIRCFFFENAYIRKFVTIREKLIKSFF